MDGPRSSQRHNGKRLSPPVFGKESAGRSAFLLVWGRWPFLLSLPVAPGLPETATRP